MISWDSVQERFAWDGSLRDIYIAPATMENWAALWPLLQGCPGAVFSLDGLPQPPPATVQEVFALRPSANPMLRLKVGSAWLCFHFFSAGEIECDIDPREVVSQSNLDALLGFMRQMGDRTGKRVGIAPENCPADPFITYDPVRKQFRTSQPDTR